jgi:hypothetical protein
MRRQRSGALAVKRRRGIGECIDGVRHGLIWAVGPRARLRLGIRRRRLSRVDRTCAPAASVGGQLPRLDMGSAAGGSIAAVAARGQPWRSAARCPLRPRGARSGAEVVGVGCRGAAPALGA